MNPMNLIKNMLGLNDPKEIAMKLIGQNNNPIFSNLIDMANKGDSAGIENFARNYMKEQGKDFDTEFNNFKNMFSKK